MKGGPQAEEHQRRAQLALHRLEVLDLKQEGGRGEKWRGREKEKDRQRKGGGEVSITPT